MAFASIYLGQRVLITGHTGFKGAWLAEWLVQLGAEVTGFSLPPTQPALFTQLGTSARVRHLEGDVRDLPAVEQALAQADPNFIFHLAAQALVRPAYQHPVETYATNVMGTVNLLDAIRRRNRPCVVVAATSDKCYENRGWQKGYDEEDAMGGYDPYSSSKGAAELAIASFRRSFFNPADSPIQLASVRSGNVIGGGDWAADRIVPDCVRALLSRNAISVRNRHATRPWQHVLDPLSGYLWLGAVMSGATTTRLPPAEGASARAFNFGPAAASTRTVEQLVIEVLKHWPGSWVDHSDESAPHEAAYLSLITTKAETLLGWHPTWDFAETIAQTISWYRTAPSSAPVALAQTLGQIETFASTARQRGIAWAR